MLFSALRSVQACHGTLRFRVSCAFRNDTSTSARGGAAAAPYLHLCATYQLSDRALRRSHATYTRFCRPLGAMALHGLLSLDLVQWRIQRKRIIGP